MAASRHRSRELAVQFIYKWPLQPGAIGSAGEIEKFFREQALDTDHECRPYFESLVRGLIGTLPVVDQEIEASLANWRFDRVEKVDLAILRLAVFEMLHFEGSDPPDGPVVINEGVQLAKRFGGADSPSFINGILDAVYRRSLSLKVKA